MNKSLFISILIGTTLLAPALSLASEQPSPRKIPIKLFDKDANGWVSKKEFSQVRQRIMAFSSAEKAKQLPKFSDFDKNNDGKLVLEEMYIY